MADADARQAGGRVAVLAAAVAALPVAVATAQALADGWTPSSDDGVIALRAFDVLSEDPPLVGQYSQTSSLIGEPAYSPGPLLYWLLAVPAHLGPGAITLTMGVLSCACVAGAVLLAGRRGGPGLAVAAAAALVLAYRALPVEVPYEIWNAWSGLFPFTLLLFVAWSVACGEYRLLPVLVLTASFVVQAHLTYLVPALLATAVAIAGLLLWHRRAAPGAGRWAIAAVVVALVAWSAPAVDQLSREPGNLGQVVRLATDDHETAGAQAGLRATARTIGVPPWWTLPARSHPERVVEMSQVPLLTSATAVLVLGGLLAALVAAIRRRRHEIAAAAALGLALCVAVAAVVAGMPGGHLGFSAVGYVLAWTSPAGMWVWLALGWSAWSLLAPTRAVAAVRGRVPAWAPLGIAAALAVAVTASRDYHPTDRLPPGLKDYELIDATVARVTDAVAGSDGVLIDSPVGVRNSLTFQSAIAYSLRREGLAFSVPARLVKEMGAQYAPHAGYEHVLAIRDGDEPPPANGRVLVRNRHVTVVLSRRP